MIKDITELNFPQYATLSQAKVTIPDMGEPTVTAQIKIDGDIVPDFTYDWAVAFQGQKYIMPLRIPQGSVSNDSMQTTVDLIFQHWAVYQLKRHTFTTIQPIDTGTYLADEEVASVSLNLGDFCNLLRQVLQLHYGDKIGVDLNPEWKYDETPIFVSINHSLIWNVISETLFDLYGVRWEIAAAGGNSNTVKDGERYTIRVGYPAAEVSHIFEYGFDGGLMKIERQVQSEEIRNLLRGRGGEQNVPFRYFKNTDPKNPNFKPDPDWVVELKNIYFPNLMGATFRSYIQGWKAAHINQKDSEGKRLYEGYEAVGEENAYSAWAYHKGYTDAKFRPVEFVADEITISPAAGDKTTDLLPGYAPYVKKGSSLDKYGPLFGTLDNNEDIYPTIQGTGLDIAVDVEQIQSDDVAAGVENDAKSEDKTINPVTAKVQPGYRDVSGVQYVDFAVAAGKKADITGDASVKAYTPGRRGGDKTEYVVLKSYSIKVVNAVTGEEHPASGIPEGSWKFTVNFTVQNTSEETLTVNCAFENIKIISATPDERWQNSFDIWVKNIWNSTRLEGETDTQYSERVWKPILGDREGSEAAVVFTTGMLVHEDYEFTIVEYPKPDTSKTWEEKDKDGNVTATHDSHWRIRLAKSDAELEATGLYVPSTQKQGKAGDKIAFIGTELVHDPYVIDAEKRLDDWKKDQLGELAEIKPTFVVTTDRVRLGGEGKPDALINQLRAGNSLRIADSRLIRPIGDAAYETLYLQSITYTYREPTSDDAALNPDVEIVLGNDYATAANPVSIMQSDITALQRQVGSISNIEQAVRATGDKLYLRKDGISDRSYSPTQFFSLLTSGDFVSGIIGGTGWGFYKDFQGNWVLETDRIKARQNLEVNTLVINQAEGRGGLSVDTAAFMTITRVEETADGYECYFDQKNGSVANLFKVGDVAYCERWTEDNTELKFYKRRVVDVTAHSVTLTKSKSGAERPESWPDSGVNGTGVPEEDDCIIHYGSYTDPERQYVKVRDVVGGGYERYIEKLNSVNAGGVEYHFVGMQSGQRRWFVGNKDLVAYSGDGNGSYMEYVNRKFSLHNVALSVESTIGDKTIGEFVGGIADVKLENFDYLRKALKDRTTIDGGLVLSSLLKMGVNNEDYTTQTTYSGLSGLYDATKPGGGIAMWFGGDMLDRLNYYDWNESTHAWDLKDGASVAGLRIAKGVDRMDGSGYRADGNLWWDTSGKVHADPLSFFVGENTVGNVLSLFKFLPANMAEFSQTKAVEPQRVFTKLRLGSADGTEYVELTYQNGSLMVGGDVIASGNITAYKANE